MTILSKRRKPDIFESHDSLKLIFTNIRDLRSNFVERESFPESNSPNILALCETNLDDSIDWQFLCEGLLSFNPKGFFYSNTWSCSLCEGRTSFCTWFLSRKLCGFLLMFSTGFTSFSILLPFPLIITLFVFMHRFDAILSNMDDLLLINPLAGVFASLLPHKDWLNLFWWNW